MVKYFSLSEQEELVKNPNILRVLKSNVVYTDDFKKQACHQHYDDGVSCKEVFRQGQIPDWLNIKDYAKSNIKRWRTQVSREFAPKIGRPTKVKKLVEDMGIEELKAHIAYLEAENEFLKKLNALEEI